MPIGKLVEVGVEARDSIDGVECMVLKLLYKGVLASICWIGSGFWRIKEEGRWVKGFGLKGIGCSKEGGG